MNPDNPEMHAMVRWLIATEAAGFPVDKKSLAVVQVFDRLQQMLLPFIGTFGYRALLSRAVKVTAAKNPLLAAAQVNEACTLELGDLLDDECEEALLMQFFELLSGFIGAPLTMRLVHGVWTDAPYNDIDPNIEEPS